MPESTSTSKSSSTSIARPGTGSVPNGSSGKTATATNGKPNAKPWVDLAPNEALQKQPREKTTLWVTLELTKAEKGATLEEIRAAYGTMIAPHMTTHDPKAVMKFMSEKRGWGFHMVKSGANEGRIKLVVK